MSDIGNCIELGVDEFIASYLPPPDQPLAEYNQDHEASHRHISQSFIPSSKQETCSRLREAFNIALRNSVSPVKSTKPQEFYEISHTQPNVKQLKIDLCMFLQSEHETAPYQVQGSLTEARTLLAWVELPVFVELELEAAPFNFDDNAFVVTEPDLGGKSQARLACCAGEIQLYQHRVFLFTIWIQRDWVRLMRWDRRALVLSSAFNYVEDPTRLMEFLCRFANASQIQRGHDASVIFAARSEIDMILRYDPRNRWERTYHAEMTHNLDIYPIRKVIILKSSLDGESGIPEATQEHAYLIGRHRYAEHEPMGSGTKCYVVYGLAERRLLFLKDFWYTPRPPLLKESAAYDALKRAGVRNIATIVWGGDVDGHHTDPTRGVSVRRHHRIVFGTLGRPLESHIDQPELIRAMRDALVAHSDAYNKAHILYGDISPANILIDIETGSGFLNDWHMSMPADWASGQTPERDTRMGTWMTMSTSLLIDPYKRNALQDALESFVHTAALMRLRFWPHKLSPRHNSSWRVDVSFNNKNANLSRHLYWTYYVKGVTGPGCPPMGGDSKAIAFYRKKDPVAMPDCPLQLLLVRLYKLFGDYYDAVEAKTQFPALSNHDALLDLFEEAAQAMECSIAKTKDQFLGICSPSGELYDRSIGHSQRTSSIPLFDAKADPPRTKRRRHKSAV